MPKVAPPLIYRGNDSAQSRFNEEVGLVLRALASSPLGSFNIVDVSVAVTPTKVKHLLGKPWTGWVVIDSTGADKPYRVDGPSGNPANPDTHFFLQAAVAVTVRLLVF